MASDAPRRSSAATAAAFVAVYAGAPLVGFVLFAALMKSGLLAAMPILFYRGLVAIGGGALVLFLLVGWLARRARIGLGWRDAWSASVAAAALNLCILVVLPVTIDRSISVFLLGEMAAHPERAYSAAELRQIFKTTYVDEYRQIERRIDEQARSGNIARVDAGYTISPQGRAFMQLCVGLAWLFDADPRFVAPAAR